METNKNKKQEGPIIDTIVKLLPSAAYFLKLFLMRTPRKGKRIRNVGILLEALAILPELLELVLPQLLQTLTPEQQQILIVIQQILAAFGALHIVGGQVQIEGNPDEVFKKKDKPI